MDHHTSCCRVAALEAELKHEKEQRARVELALQQLALTLAHQHERQQPAQEADVPGLRQELEAIKAELGELRQRLDTSKAGVSESPSLIDLLDFSEEESVQRFDKGKSKAVFSQPRRSARPRVSAWPDRHGSSSRIPEVPFDIHRKMIDAATFTEDMTEEEQWQIWREYASRFRSIGLSKSQWRDYYNNVVRMEYLSRLDCNKEIAAAVTLQDESVTELTPPMIEAENARGIEKPAILDEIIQDSEAVQEVTSSQVVHHENATGQDIVDAETSQLQIVTPPAHEQANGTSEEVLDPDSETHHVMVNGIPKGYNLATILDSIKPGPIFSATHCKTSGMLTRPAMDADTVILVFSQATRATEFVQTCKIHPLQLTAATGQTANLHLSLILCPARLGPWATNNIVNHHPDASRKLKVRDTDGMWKVFHLTAMLASDGKPPPLRATDMGDGNSRLEYSSIRVACEVRNKLIYQHKLATDFVPDTYE